MKVPVINRRIKKTTYLVNYLMVYGLNIRISGDFVFSTASLYLIHMMICTVVVLKRVFQYTAHFPRASVICSLNCNRLNQTIYAHYTMRCNQFSIIRGTVGVSVG